VRRSTSTPDAHAAARLVAPARCAKEAGHLRLGHCRHFHLLSPASPRYQRPSLRPLGLSHHVRARHAAALPGLRAPLFALVSAAVIRAKYPPQYASPAQLVARPPARLGRRSAPAPHHIAASSRTCRTTQASPCETSPIVPYRSLPSLPCPLRSWARGAAACALADSPAQRRPLCPQGSNR
jgi:hypothetical protein